MTPREEQLASMDHGDLLAEIGRLEAEVEALRSQVPHPGDGTCDVCGSAPVHVVNVCASCSLGG